MERVELHGAPAVAFWLVVAAVAVAAPILLRALLRRGRGERRAHGFWIQRAPQLAAGVNVAVTMVAFEVIELELGSGEPAFGRRFMEDLPGLLPVFTLAVVLPGWIASTVSWVGVPLLSSGLVFMVGGWYSLGASFSPDVEVFRDHALRTRGLYGLVMHPVYSGVVQALLGWSLCAVSPAGVLLALLVTAPLFLRRAWAEERLLTESLGPRYGEYARRLGHRRLLPRLVLARPSSPPQT